MVDAIPDIEGIDDTATLKTLLKQTISMMQSLQATVDNLNVTLQKRDAENAELRRMLFGKKREKMPPKEREVRRRRGKADPAKTKEKRRKRAEAKKQLPTEQVVHEVPEEATTCPECGGHIGDDLGEGEVSYEYEYIPPKLVRREHVRRKKICTCGHIVTAPGPARVAEGVQCGPGLHAHVVVSKCADSIPLYRQAKQLERAGVPASRSTLCDAFHRVARLLEPLRARMLEIISASEYVNADETPIPVQDEEKARRAYMWTFIDDKIVSYVYSPSRSGETPVKVLGESKGFLQVDGYSGYNPVTTPETRDRVGCWAHVRRYFYKALETEPELAQHVIDKILDLYLVEYDAATKEILRTQDHLDLRQALSSTVITDIEKWLDEQEPLHPPQGPLGKAITYAKNNWESLILFLDDPKLSLDNNVSERNLRLIALGRKNFLFVGNDEAGESLAINQSLVSSCILNDIDPEQYITDVLIRIQTHPQSRIDELLPHLWKAPG